MRFMEERARDFIAYIYIYIYVDTFIIGEFKKPCSLEKTLVIKRSFI